MIDVATQQEIIDWFQFRHVSDNDRFPVYFNRQVKLYQNQYLNYLRIESTEIDPMVVEYMERQILRDSVTDTKTLGTDSNSSDNTNTRTITNSGSDKTTMNTNRSNTTELSTNMDDTVTHGGEDKTEAQSVDSGENKTTENSINNASTTVTTDGTTLTSITPDSAIYPTKTVTKEDGSTYQIAAYPDDLNWQYVSNQQQARNASHTTSGAEVLTTTGEEKSNSTTSSTSVEYGHTIQTNGSNYSNGEEEITGTDETTNEFGRVVSESMGEQGKSTSTHDTTVGTNINDDTRERYTGRHEAPQDLLSRARTYIVQTNAFRWFLEKLDPCFLWVYDI